MDTLYFEIISTKDLNGRKVFSEEIFLGKSVHVLGRVRAR